MLEIRIMFINEYISVTGVVIFTIISGIEDILRNQIQKFQLQVVKCFSCMIEKQIYLRTVRIGLRWHLKLDIYIKMSDIEKIKVISVLFTRISIQSLRTKYQ